MVGCRRGRDLTIARLSWCSDTSCTRSTSAHCFHNNAGKILAQGANIGLDLVEALIHRVEALIDRVKLGVHEALHGVELARDEFKRVMYCLSRRAFSSLISLLDAYSHAAQVRGALVNVDVPSLMVILWYNSGGYMHTAKLRSVGGSTMVAIPPHIIEELRLGPNSTVRLTVERGKIVIRPQPRKGRIGLKARLAMCDFSKKMKAEDREWANGPRAGSEEI